MEVHVSIKAETLWSVDLGPLGTLNITNSFLTMLLVMGFLLIVCSLIARRAQIIPSRIQSVYEVLAEFVRGLATSTAGARDGMKILPLCGALFFFILFSNYSGLLPGVGTIGIYETEEEADTSETVEEAEEEAVAEAEGEHHEVLVPFFRSPSADLNMTLAMALVTFTVVQVVAIKRQGVGGRKHMADPWFLFPIEVVSELSRIISLSFRLFGNIFAGEVLVTVMYAMAKALIEKTSYILFFAFGLPTIFLFLEVLFGFVQALVFSLLTVIYISLVLGAHDEHEEEHAPTAHQPAPAPAGAGD